MNWYDWHTVTERLEGRCLALTEGLPYSVSLDTNIRTAECNNTTGKIVINPIAFQPQIITSDRSLRDKTNYLITRALLGHEVLHAIYSNAKMPKEPTEGMISNILEDARIEGIGSYDSTVSRELFKLLNNLSAKKMHPFTDLSISSSSSWLQLMLMWRHGMPMPTLSTPEMRMKLSILLDMCNQSLYAVDTDEINTMSKKIKDFCKIDSNDLDFGKFDSQNISNLSASMTGSNDTKQNPRSKNRPAPKYDPNAPMEDDTSGKGNPNESGSSSSKSKPGGKGSAKGKDNVSSDKAKSTEQSNDNQTEPVPDEEEEVDDTSTTPPDNGGDVDSTDEAGDDSDADAGDDSDTPPSDESTEEDDTDIETPQEETPGVDQDGSGGSGVGSSIPSLEEMIGEIQDKLGEDLERTLEDLGKLSKSDTVDVDDAYYKGESVYRVSNAPYMPLYVEAKPLANTIVRELRLQLPNVSTAADKNSGRFKMRYYLRNNETPFAKKKSMGKDVPPMALSLLIDRSGSMSGRDRALKVTAMAIVIACEQLHIPLDIRIFSGNNHLKKFDEWGPQIFARIAGTKVTGGTTMLPSLRSAARDLEDRPELLKQVVLIHDGGPDNHDSVKAWLDDKSNPDTFALYVIPAELSKDNQEYYRKSGEQCMSRLFDPRRYVITGVDKALSAWCSYMKIFRNHFAKKL